MEAGAYLGGHAVHPQPGPHAGLVEQGHERLGVGALRVGAVVGRFPVAIRHGSEELDGLVDQVRAEVVEDAAAFGQDGGVAPVPEAFGPPPFKPRLKGADLAQAPSRTSFLQRQEVGVPPAVLEHRQLHPAVGRPGDQLLAMGRGR